MGGDVDARFENKVVVITGGGAGIGRTYAHRFADEGAAIVIADVDEAAGMRVVDELQSAGSRAMAVVMDVSHVEDVEAMVAQTTETFGGIDILVNNAAIHLQHAQLPITMEAVPKWRAVMDVNVIGPLICTIACRESMTSRGGGSVLNQSSMAAYSAGGAYGVSKSALNTLTVALAGELAGDGIRVNGIAPSLVDSEAAVEWMNDPVRQGVEQTIVDGQMIKRLGRMGDLANLVLFLCSEEASFITGQTVLIDGGFTKKPF
jgi:3-oxoacyl-[acyl-carrier protein] reductase